MALAFALVAGCTSSSSADSDHDGVTDADEASLHTIQVHGPDGMVTRTVKSDPTKADTDSDGIPDRDEYRLGTDPSNADTDGDGLLDGHNLTLVPDSPLAIEWRAQGVLEVPRGTFWGELDLCPARGGLDPLSSATTWRFGETLGDGDALRGWNVTAHGETRHVAADPCQYDADRDGLSNAQEKALGTDPNLADTDGDGVKDGIDVDPLHDVGLALRVTSYSGDPGDLVEMSVGSLRESHRARENATFALNVDDASASRATDPLTVLVDSRDADGAPRIIGAANATFVLVPIDLATGTTGTVEAAGGDVTFVIEWSVTRS